jgi:hypothetical protein
MRSPAPFLSRRRLLARLAAGAALVPFGLMLQRVRAAPPLLSPAAPEAKAVHYVEDAKQAKGAIAGDSCANCALYQGASGSLEGPCQIFSGKDVKAAGWCSSWAPQM